MSSDRPPIRLVLLWHFHQPDYTDSLTGAAAMPWTRLHALKDYVDVTEHLVRHPGVRATVNVVPSLLDQIRDIADGTAPPDPFLAIAERPASSLSPDERRFVVSQFFSFNRDTMAKGLRRVMELSALRGDYGIEDLPAAVVDRFDEAAIRDMQVLFHLVWCGPILRADPRVRALRDKGQRYTEDEKRTLLTIQRDFLRDVLPRWKRLLEAGNVEFSVTPYYHPILPLLCGLDSAREALPGIRLPAAAFRHAEDARLQLEQALGAFEKGFGRRAAGGWPSEGSISEASLGLMADAGYRWAASDEDVLFGSLGESVPADRAEVRRGTLLYRPWKHGRGPVLLFRDHDLSDRIGFVYSAWSAATAVEDFIRRLHHLRAALPPEEGPYTVSVILDGENAWEYYPDNGQVFLDSLYAALESDPGVVTLAARDAADPAAARTLPRVVAGSWIGRNLATWIGHPEKNRAWELLAETREAIAKARGAPSFADPAWRAVFAAEGSDWFWWFGDDHPTPHAAEFDAGFRRKLRAAHRFAGLEPPAVLTEPIRRSTARGFVPPTGPVRASVDGRVTDYFEWLPAGRAAAASGAMQSATRLVREVRFGRDDACLFLRLDPFDAPASASLGGGVLIVRVPGEPERTVRVPLPERGEGRAGEVRVAVDRIVEAAVPVAMLAGPGEALRFQVEVEKGQGGSQRVPAEGSLTIPAAADDPSQFDWIL
ncbi:MAG: glycoside hydrolase [Acidobacteriia bacterium]|nr:glycoside hydrolase [Terriglobia bacterium]